MTKEYYVLGYLHPGGSLVVLCRPSGKNPGPAYCVSRSEAMQLRTILLNDVGGKDNPLSRTIISELVIYKGCETLPWTPGTLFMHLDPELLEPVEPKQSLSPAGFEALLELEYPAAIFGK